MKKMLLIFYLIFFTIFAEVNALPSHDYLLNSVLNSKEAEQLSKPEHFFERKKEAFRNWCKSLSKNNIRFISTLSGLASGLSAGIITNLACATSYNCATGVTYLVNPLFATAIVFPVTGLITYYKLLKNTPEGKFDRSKAILISTFKKLKEDLGSSKTKTEIETQQDIEIIALQKHANSLTPLHNLAQKLTKHLTSLDEAQTLAEDILRYTKNESLIQKTKNIINFIPKLYNELQAIIKLIITNPKFKEEKKYIIKDKFNQQAMEFDAQQNQAWLQATAIQGN